MDRIWRSERKEPPKTGASTLHTDGYPVDWTERLHWVVMVVESPGDERCAGHHPTRKLADEQAAYFRSASKCGGKPFPKVYVTRTCT